MIPTITKPTDPFEAKRTASLKEILAHITAAAKDDGLANLPAPTGDNLSRYFNPFLHMYFDLAAQNKAWFTPQTATHIVIGNNTEYEEAMRELRNKKGELGTREISVNGVFESTPEPPKYKKSRLANMIICILAVLDMGLNVGLFQSWGFPLVFSWILSLCTAVLFAVVAHMVPKAFNKIKSPKAKKYTGVALAIALSVLLYVLGVERATYLTLQTGYYHSSVPFTILSVLFLGVSIALSYFYIPYTEGEKEAIRQYEKALADKEAVDREVNEIEAKETALRARKTETETAGAYTLETAHIGHKQIESAARHGLAVYIRTNVRYRPDGLCPDCFDQPFDFNFPDFTLKPEGNE